MTCLVWSQSSCHSISASLNLVFSQSRNVSIEAILNRIFSQLDLFSVGEILNRILSQSDLGSIGSWLNSILAQFDLGSIGSWLNSILRGRHPQLDDSLVGQLTNFVPSSWPFLMIVFHIKFCCIYETHFLEFHTVLQGLTAGPSDETGSRSFW